MKKIFLFLSIFCMAQLLQGQTINAAEFFVDADPGKGNGTPVTIATPAANVNFAATVPTAALSNGFHFAAIRTQDNAGKWGLYEARGFYISSAVNNVTNIVAAEFFIDTDPGAGNGTNITLTGGPAPVFAATVPTASLAAGFHFVAIRTKDADSKWSLFEARGFYISNATNNVGNIVAAEFFVDTDPGVGNGTTVSLTTGPNPTFVATVPTTAMTEGFHFAAIRIKDTNGKWGLYEARGFYISTATASVTDIVAAESFTDTDPGAGNGTPVTLTPGPNPVFVAAVSTASLSPGFHFSAIRTKDATGKWGLYAARGFYISTQTANMPNMAQAEYFIDTDPGVGNASAFSIPNAANFNQNFALNIPVGTTPGIHKIAIRVKDANGKWGLFEFADVEVGGVLPLRLLSFDAFKKDNTAALEWKTDNELNTSHFDVERSTNGVDFIKIGTVAAMNTAGINQYTFTDIQPAKGINLYRLKQVDKDSRAVYSSIAKVLFSSNLNFAVYPNPATDKLKLQLSNSGKWVSSIYDAQGRLIQQQNYNSNTTLLEVNVAALVKGNYIIVLNNGMETLHGKFVKQ